MTLANKVFLAFLYLTASLVAVNAIAAPTCLNQNAVQDIKTAFEIKAANSQHFDSCRNDTNLYTIFDTISLLKSFKFEGKINAPLNQGILSTEFWKYFTARANKIIDEDKNTNATCAAGFVAYVQGRSNDGVIHLCETFYSKTMTIYERISTLMHEVRHFDQFRHVTCTRGIRKGNLNSCDQKISDKGSYAVTVESLAKIAVLSKNLPLATKTQLKFTTLSWIDSSMNEPVFPKDFSAIYFQNKDKGYIYDGRSKPLATSALPMNGKLISRKDGVVFFPEDKSDALSFDFLSKKFNRIAVQGSNAIKFNRTPLSERQQVLDISNGVYSSCALLPRMTTCTHRDEKNPHDREIKLPFNAVALYESQEIGLKDRNFIYIRSEDNSLYQMHVGKDNAQPTQVVNAVKGFNNMTLLNNIMRVGLSDLGELQILNRSNWQTHPLLLNERFEIMTKPFNWTEDLYD